LKELEDMKVMLFMPELILLLGSLVVFGISLGEQAAKAARNAATGVLLLAAAAAVYTRAETGSLFFAAYKVDLFSQLFKMVITAGAAAVVLFGRDLKGIGRGIRGEYYLLLLLSVTGLVMLVSSVELMTLLIALELSSCALYLLVPMRDDTGTIRIQMESATKYVMFGIVATGVMLYGMSLLFGLTGSTHLNEIMARLPAASSQPVAWMALLLVMGGLFFKLAVVPFQFWAPDVYQGASNDTAAFIASIPKLGAVAVLIRVASLGSPDNHLVVKTIGVLALVSMFYGNLAALVQKDLKRMLGFSGIAHGGYILFGLLTMREAGFAFALFYVIGYTVMTMACFLVISKVSTNGENVLIEDLAGLHRRSPLLALTLGAGMFGLAGIPPFVGFMGKFFLLAGVLREGMLWFVILAVINTAIAIYYYLSVVRVAYCTDPEARPAVAVDRIGAAVGVAFILAILALGLMPQVVISRAQAAVHAIRGM
jgi:NADH-quinone oxidoreductase subunit N